MLNSLTPLDNRSPLKITHPLNNTQRGITFLPRLVGPWPRQAIVAGANFPRGGLPPGDVRLGGGGTTTTTTTSVPTPCPTTVRQLGTPREAQTSPARIRPPPLRSAAAREIGIAPLATSWNKWHLSFTIYHLSPPPKGSGPPEEVGSLFGSAVEIRKGVISFRRPNKPSWPGTTSLREEELGSLKPPPPGA